MNPASLRATALLALLALSANAADKTDPDPAARSQIEDKLHSANDRLNEAAREISELTAQLYGNGLTLLPSRTILGVNVGDEATAKSDTGVRIISVSPGGPASAAGLKANDVILSFDGKKLQKNAEKSPRQQLLALTHDTKPNSSVTLEFERDGKVQSVKVAPKSITLFMDVMDPDALPGLQKFGEKFADSDAVKQLGQLSWNFDSNGFGSAEFLELTPGLGHYFGTDKGILVVHPPTDTNLKLEEGDVILDIDGRVPMNGSHALRILSSYRGGEILKLHIMRQQKRMELAIEMRAEKLHAARLPQRDIMTRDVMLSL